MKKNLIYLFLLILLISVAYLIADISLPTTFWYNEIKLSEHNSIVKEGEKTYIIFIDKLHSTIVFAKGESGVYQFQDIESDCVDYYFPTLCVPEPETVLVTFNRRNSEAEVETVIGKSYNSGVNFEYSVLENLILHPVITCNDGLIKITGYSGEEVSASNYGYFTNTEESENYYDSEEAGIIKFGGKDVMHTPLHTNSDIWVEQWEEGYNGGWPTFYRHVTTSGRIRLYPSGTPLEDTAPMEDIFRGGYTENHHQVELIDNFSDLEENSVHLADAADILYIELNGDSYTGYCGVIESYVETFDVYSWYPASVGWVNFAIENDVNWFTESDLIYTNHVTLYDTIWTELSGDIPNDSAFFTESDLWIKGEVAGKQSWGTAGNVRILGNIYYQNTNLGGYPDGFSGYNDFNEPEFNGTVNTTDFFSLSAGGRINIGYKYRHPGTDEKISISSGENSFLYLFGQYSAVSIGDEEVYGQYASHYDGSFSFEYQHPHGSPPNFVGFSPFTLNDTAYTYIDLHKYIFPSDDMVAPQLNNFNLTNGGFVYPSVDMRSTGYPNYSLDYVNSIPNTGPDFQYPYLTDYPWYNPVWPEPINNQMFERGILRLNGSLVQRRRGFIHRSGGDEYNHADENHWDLEYHKYGAEHDPTGFEKRYYHDTRLRYVDFPGAPQVANFLGDPKIVVLESSDFGNTFSLINEYNLEGSSISSLRNISFIVRHESVVLAEKNYTETTFWTSMDGVSYNELTVPSTNLNYHLNNGILYINMLGTINGFTLDNLELVYSEDLLDSWFFDITSLEGNLAVLQFDYETTSLDYIFTLDGEDEFEGNLQLYQNIEPDESWDINIYGLNETELITMINHGDCKISYGTLDGIVPQQPEEVLPIKPVIGNFPNPFNPSTTISFNLPKDVKEASIEIFNIKGQMVKSFSVISTETIYGEVERSSSTTHNVTWNGTDSKNNPVSSGVYFGVLKSEDKIIAKRKLMLLK